MKAYMRARTSGLAAFALALAAAAPASALVIELKDVAADRVERQRLNAEGALPLPGTPDIGSLNDRLKAAGVSLGSPIVIRIFKAESELEIWKEKSGAYFLFATYPICHWSGTIGPKLRTGDKQAPEGFYTLTRGQLHHSVRWPRSLDLGFPNVFDQSQARTGSDILIHGGCSSVGCFAMTNPVMDEIYELTRSAMEAGETHVPVHVFPFRMTDENLKARPNSPWMDFWTNLKEGHDAFEETKQQVKVATCNGRYSFEPMSKLAGPIDACAPTLVTIKDQDQWLKGTPPPPLAMPRNEPASPASLETETKLGNIRRIPGSDAPSPPPRAELQ